MPYTTAARSQLASEANLLYENNNVLSRASTMTIYDTPHILEIPTGMGAELINLSLDNWKMTPLHCTLCCTLVPKCCIFVALQATNHLLTNYHILLFSTNSIYTFLYSYIFLHIYIYIYFFLFNLTHFLYLLYFCQHARIIKHPTVCPLQYRISSCFTPLLVAIPPPIAL